ncbi:phage head maturation protease [Candidatus Caldarchaeum subterraneum]|uniref:Phage head maturation protease n=1 Tax=Caldiarchaeum subterraneum TaxID=311458 RepID=E6N5V4_CALS0|nr:phage head maturation protease [Candidatus Caldarchaeum subterraneum]BAJ50473.1 phage head maturation protease [Candidatus Caldarchaeum subterraneum]
MDAVRWITCIQVRPCLEKTLDDEVFAGYLEGVAATSDIDLEGDIFSEEVFKANAANLVGKPILLQHGRSQAIGEQAVGQIIDAKHIPGKGLWIKAGIYKAFGDVWRMVKNGFLRFLSIGGYVKRVRFHDKYREIEEAEITEVSLTHRAANPRAQIITVFSKSWPTAPKSIVSGNEAIAKPAAQELDTPYFRKYWSRLGSHRIKQEPLHR